MATSYIYQGNEKIPQQWVMMCMACVPGKALPADAWLEARAQACGYQMIAPCSTFPLSMFSSDSCREKFSPTINKRTVYFNPGVTGHTPDQINYCMFHDLSIRTFGLYISVTDWSGSFQSELSTLYWVGDTAGSIGQMFENTVDGSVDFIQFITPGDKPPPGDEPFFSLPVKITLVAAGALIAVAGVKYGIPAWQKRSKR